MLMFLILLCLFATGALASEANCATCVDLTRFPGAYGTDVVLACVRLIKEFDMFPDDSGLLRKIALVESKDGNSAFTYLTDFHGGIWGVNRTSYEQTKSASQGILNGVKDHFQIDWINTEWMDLRKPLYSAIAARIYLHIKAGETTFENLNNQLTLWKMFNGYRREESDFIDVDVSNTSFDVEEIQLGRHIQREINGTYYIEIGHNHNVIEIDFSVSLGSATLFVSNVINPSEAVHCGMTKGGRLFLNPMEMTSYGSSDKLYISVEAMDRAIVHIAIMPAAVGGSVNFESESTEFVFGMFSNHPDAGSLPITVTITTSEDEPVNFVIESIDNDTLITGTVNPNKIIEVVLPDSYVVSYVNETGKGLLLKTENGKKVSMSVGSHYTYSTDSYLALPLIEYVGLESYTYYAITPNTNTSGLKNRVLVIGGYDHTDITIVTTQEAAINGTNLEPNVPYTVKLGRLETLMIESEFTLTGTKVVANKPVTFLSGHQCTVIPQTGNSCDFAIEQFPPTITWGKKFMFSMLSTRTGGSHFTVLTSEDDTDVFLWCSLPSTNQSLEHNFTLSTAGNYKALEVAPDEVVCSLTTTKPSLLVVLGTSENADEGNGDPLLIMLPPAEQYSTQTSYRKDEKFNNSYVNIVVMGDRSDFFVDNVALSDDQWNEVQAPIVGGLGFVTQLPINDSIVHNLTTTNSNTNFSAVVYGFEFSVGYGQKAGMRLNPIANTFKSTSEPRIEVSEEGNKLTCLTGGIPAYAFRWERSGMDIKPSCKYSIISNGYDNSVLIINGGGSEDSGEYKCIFYSYYQDSASVSVSRNVEVEDPAQKPQPKAPTISSEKGEFGDTSGNNVTIDVSTEPSELEDQVVSWRYENSLGKITDIDTNSDSNKYMLSANRLSLTVKNLTLGEHGSISVAVRNNGGTALLSVSLVVYVSADVQKGSETMHERNVGESITFNCSADGIHRPKIAWRRNGTLLLQSAKYIINEINIEGHRNIKNIEGRRSSLTVLNLVEKDRAQYSCRADNEAGVPSTESFTLQVYPDSSPTPPDFCSDNPCKEDGTCISLSTTHQCRCREGFTGTNCEEVVQVFIEPQIVTPPTDTRANLYESIQLMCTATGNPPPVIEWYKDNKLVENINEDTSILVFNSIEVDDRGIYRCRVWNKNPNGETVYRNSKNVILNIEGVVQYEAFLTPGTNQSISTVIEKINEYLSGRSPTNGTSFFFVKAKTEMTSVSSNTEYPIIVTLVTESGGSSELLNTVKSEINMAAKTLAISISTENVDRFDGCPSTNTTIPSQSRDPQLEIVINWPETDIGQTASVDCPCGSLSSANRLTAIRYCGGDFILGGNWTEANVMSCNFSDLARRLCRLSNLETPEKIQRLDNLTDNSSSLGSTEVIVSVSLLTDTTDAVAGNETLTQSFLSVADNLLTVNGSILQESVVTSNTSARLQEAILAVADSLPLSNTSDSAVFTQSTFAVSVQRINFTRFGGLFFGANVNLSQTSEKEINRNDIFYEDAGNTTAEIILPPNLFDSSPTSNVRTNTSRISNSVFLTDGAFLTRTRDRRVVGSLIISARVVGQDRKNFQNLDPPVNLSFQARQDLMNEANPQCVFFDTTADDGFGSWATYGCNVTTVGGGFVVCNCNHLTSFSILFDVSPRLEPKTPSPAEHTLSAITYIGLCVSIVCLLITIISYLSSKKLRTSEAGLLLINLCIALIGLYVSFIAAIHSKENKMACAFIAAILQYFFLVTFLSMAAEAVNLYLKLVVILGKKIEKFVIKSIIIIWVVPVFVVVFSIVPDHEESISKHFCRVDGPAYYVGMIVPFLIIYLFNWGVFILTITTLIREGYRKKSFHGGVDPSTSRFVRQQLISAITLSTLLGIGWGIGLFATGDIYNNSDDTIRHVIDAIFVCVTAFHGFFVLIMHCLRSKDVRKIWKRWFYGVTRQDTTEATTSTFDQVFKKKGKGKAFQHNKLKGVSSDGIFSSDIHTEGNISYANTSEFDSTLQHNVRMHEKKSSINDYEDISSSTFCKNPTYDEPSFKEDTINEKPPLPPE